jgi:hypothetical protein
MFGGWWYGFFWDGKFADFRWITFGLRLLVNGHPAVVTLIFVCGLVLFSIVMLAPRRLFAILDRFRRRIIVACVATIVIAALTVYLTADNLVEYLNLLPGLDASSAALNAQLEARLEQPGIDAPIYFHYLNEEAVDTFYNQLKPELEETSRNIKSTTEVKGGAEIGAGGSKVTVEGGKSGQEESKFDRSNFSPARRCLEVMKYVRKTWPTNYYTNYEDWYSKYTTLRILQAGSGAAPDPLDPLQPYDPGEDLTRQASESAQRFINKLKEQLSTVHGPVFVDGDFERSTQADNVVLTHTLIIPDRMPKLDARFKIVVPKAASQSLPDGKPLRLRVFGDVTKPLGKDGLVNVAPVAIF